MTSSLIIRLSENQKQNLKHSATQPQPKPLTAETAGGRRDTQENRRQELDFRTERYPCLCFSAYLCALCVLCGEVLVATPSRGVSGFKILTLIASSNAPKSSIGVTCTFPRSGGIRSRACAARKSRRRKSRCTGFPATVKSSSSVRKAASLLRARSTGFWACVVNWA